MTNDERPMTILRMAGWRSLASPAPHEVDEQIGLPEDYHRERRLSGRLSPSATVSLARLPRVVLRSWRRAVSGAPRTHPVSNGGRQILRPQTGTGRRPSFPAASRAN